MRALKIFSGLIYLLICMPISFYIQYTVLSSIHVDRLIWFLYWFNVPFFVAMSLMVEIAKASDKK